MNQSEQVVSHKYEALGYSVIRNGVPDFILLKDGAISFVEVKSTKEYQLSKAQERAHQLLKHNGFDVKVDVVYEISDLSRSRSVIIFLDERDDYSKLHDKYGDPLKAADEVVASRFYWTNIKDVEEKAQRGRE